MAKIHIYQKLSLKNKLSKQEKQRQNESWVWRAFQWLPDGKGLGAMSEEVRGLRSTNMQLQNSHGDVKYSVADGVAKEPRHDTWS